MSSAEALRLPEPLAPRARRLALFAAAAGMLAISLIVLISGAPIAWWLLGLCAVVASGVLVVALAEGRYFEPLTVTVALGLVFFVVRPFYLFLNSRALISYLPVPHGTSPVNSLLRLENSEIAMFATTRLHGLLQPALTRAVGACAVFLVVFVASYLAPWASGWERGSPPLGAAPRRSMCVP